MRRLFFSILACLSLVSSAFAADLPFTDVKKTDTYYEAVRSLYDAHVIIDNGDHLFRGESLMTRDFYVSLAVWVGCKKCATPSIDDIIRYQVSPFIDLSKTNPYYYCIAYAKEENITQWYILDASGKAACENGSSYTSNPFCADNSISRIEANAILLRRAKLWDDTLNTSITSRTLPLPDVSNYWYGYAKKWIDIGILSVKKDGTIGQDEKITRWEFALMAAKILEFTQCQTKTVDNTMEWAIGIVGADGSSLWKTTIQKDESFFLIPLTSTGTWEYTWKATNPITWETITWTGAKLSWDIFWAWSWVVELSIIDPISRNVVSQPTTTINVVDSSTPAETPPSVIIQADPLVTKLDKPVDFSSIVQWVQSGAIYRWDFGDGNGSTSSWNTSHTYTTPGVYTATLTVTDPVTGKTGQSSVIIRVTEWRDTDGDGIDDAIDLCPYVYGSIDNNWCPKFQPSPYQDKIIDDYKWAPWDNSRDTDGDGIWDGSDLCIFTRWTLANQGCPYISPISGIHTNICIAEKAESRWIVIGSPVCNICPCQNSIEISSPIRSCDTIFPSILSEDGKTIYSRWNFVIVP